MHRFGSEAEEQGPEGWVCLEVRSFPRCFFTPNGGYPLIPGSFFLAEFCAQGDPESFGEAPGEEEQGERRRVLDVTIGDQGRIPAWDRWVDVYVSFRDGGECFPLFPALDHVRGLMMEDRWLMA